MIKEIRKQLFEVPAGGWFYVLGDKRRTYIKTDIEHPDGTFAVVDLDKGELYRWIESLSVVEISKGRSK